MKTITKPEEVQGAITENEKELGKKVLKTLNKMSDKNKKVQISIKMLKELAENRILLEHFIETLDNNEDMNAPIAYRFAQAMVKQVKLEI